MEISITHQCQTFLLALAVGGGLSLCYDFFRFLRLLLPEQKLLIALEDLLYCLLCGIVTMKYALWASQGKLRAYLLLGEFLGWVICHFTLGQLLFAAFQKMTPILFAVLRFIYGCTLYPIYKILKKIWMFLTAVRNKMAKLCKKVSIRCNFFLKQRAILLYNLRKSEKRPIFGKHRFH